MKSVSPRVFWAVAGSGLSLRRGCTEWRFDCPRDAGHTVTLSYRTRVEGASAVYLCCHATGNVEREHMEASYRRAFPREKRARESELGCTTLSVLTAIGCTMRDLHTQAPQAADGPCHCGAPGYRVAGVHRGRPVCLVHLLDATRQPHELLFGGWEPQR